MDRDSDRLIFDEDFKKEMYRVETTNPSIVAYLKDSISREPVVLTDGKGRSVSFIRLAVLERPTRLYCVFQPVVPMEGLGGGNAIVFYLDRTVMPPFMRVETDPAAAESVMNEMTEGYKIARNRYFNFKKNLLDMNNKEPVVMIDPIGGNRVEFRKLAISRRGEKIYVVMEALMSSKTYDKGVKYVYMLNEDDNPPSFEYPSQTVIDDVMAEYERKHGSN
ncbi:MAG: hypothetical protein LUD47_04350 [Clostridia bacterium]|nr:hypothetical protein [Clostridia bacterium]